MDVIPKIGITGAPRVGKTEGLIRIMERLKDKYTFGGMITKEIEENGERVGFKIIDLMTKEERIFAHVDIDSSYRVGKYKINLKALDEFGIPAIERAIKDDRIDIVVVDEVGKMELESKKFREAIKEVLDCEKPALITLHKKSRDATLQGIRNRNNVRILEITQKNRNLLPYKIEKILEEEGV
ncbi:MAG: NTPase [Thermoplasmatales archaeon]|jgi:nucleoside-triphosphatase|nr:NTPase [Thermoplasmatales archaeon]